MDYIGEGDIEIRKYEVVKVIGETVSDYRVQKTDGDETTMSKTLFDRKVLEKAYERKNKVEHASKDLGFCIVVYDRSAPGRRRGDPDLDLFDKVTYMDQEDGDELLISAQEGVHFWIDRGHVRFDIDVAQGECYKEALDKLRKSRFEDSGGENLLTDQEIIKIFQTDTTIYMPTNREKAPPIQQMGQKVADKRAASGKGGGAEKPMTIEEMQGVLSAIPTRYPPVDVGGGKPE
jgi:hypothetical protein